MEMIIVEQNKWKKNEKKKKVQSQGPLEKS